MILFDLPTSLTYAANFMTTTCAVRREWRDWVPAIVHVDGTARPCGERTANETNRINCAMSAIGTKRTLQPYPRMSAFG